MPTAGCAWLGGNIASTTPTGSIAALAGVVGYFHLIPGEHELLTLYGRARGTFKDPNVLSAFLILPALFALQNVVTEGFWKSARNAIGLGIIALALLLAFSRASWGQFVFTSAFMLFLMYLTSDARSQRNRIILTAIAAVAAITLLLLFLLSLPSKKFSIAYTNCATSTE